MAGFGVNFAPTGEQGGEQPGQAGPGGAPVSPIQRAIQLLSLRLPRFGGQGLSPGGMAPGMLMQGPGGSGLAGILAQLLQQGGQGAPSFPAPNITPGGGGGPIEPSAPPEMPGGQVQPGGFSPGGPRPPMGGIGFPGGTPPGQPRIRGGY